GTVKKIVRLAEVNPGDHVVEVGPGLGSLTIALLDYGATVTAVEIDPILAQALPETIASRMPDKSGALQVINHDALKVEALPRPPTALIANLPYNVSVPVILQFLEACPSFQKVMVMVQSEVA